MNKLSVFKSPEDNRDYIMETILCYNNKLPNKLDLRYKLKPIRNQGDMYTSGPICGSTIKEYQEKINNNFKKYFSPMFIYNNRTNDSIKEMCGRDVMKILLKKGICPEQNMRYGYLVDKKNISNHVYDISSKYKIKAYARINTIIGLKKSLILYGPCLISFPCYSDNIKLWKPLYKGQEYIGGHAMTVVGYNEKGFIIRNSWGFKWGNKGHCLYPYSEFGYHWEIWSAYDDETYYESDNDSNYKINNKKFFCI
jgi:hypothetical protein